jgi:hypothetical protein
MTCTAVTSVMASLHRMLALALMAAAPAIAAEPGSAGKSVDITQRVRVFTAEPVSLSHIEIGDFPLEGKVRQAIASPGPPGWNPTGVTRERYLDQMEAILMEAKDWVDAQGRVIDPFAKKETGQASPRFASPGAILLHFGRAPEIRDAVFRSMGYCCRVLPSGQAKENSPDFWMRELVTAYMALETVATPEQLRKWAEGLAAVEPERIYTRVSPDGTTLATLGNWAIYAAAGEAMREAAGLKPSAGAFLWGNAFYDRYVGAQLGEFTANGMYRDPGDPITYDVATRLQVACGLAFGYDGKHRSELEELLRRGGLTTLLFASPDGYCPYGGRSAAFNFREIILTALCELEARRYRTSDPRLAGAFKRQAHRSFLSVQRWLAELKPWRHIKNGFPPEAGHGLDSYGHYSVYSLLAASCLGLATVFADDTIAETPCPAEIGGFAFELAPAFHKVFANCQGTYLEIDTAADPHYDATGLGCFTFEGVPLELGLGMPFAAPMQKWGRPAISIASEFVQPATPVAIGPAWQSGERWISLASLVSKEGSAAGVAPTSRLEVLEETPSAVEIRLSYAHDGMAIVQDYRLERGSVAIKSQVSAEGKPVSKLRFTVPLLVTDGGSRSRIAAPRDGLASVSYLGHTYQVRHGPPVKASLGEELYANRHGVYRSLVLETDGGEMNLELNLK